MYVGLIIAIVCVFTAIGSGLGYRADLWHFRTGFTILKWSFIVSAITLLVLIVCMFFIKTKTKADFIVGLIGICISASSVYIPYSWKRTLDKFPYIHDITTDTSNPPQFVMISNLRGKSDHPVAYDGPEVAEQQKKAYPALTSLRLDAPVNVVMQTAKNVLKNKMKLELIDVDSEPGRIEAVATTLLYGFKDDLVVRVQAVSDKQSLVDVRSKSRVGKSDLGQNAKRIQTFLDALSTAVSAEKN